MAGHMHVIPWLDVAGHMVMAGPGWIWLSLAGQTLQAANVLLGLVGPLWLAMAAQTLLAGYG